MSFGYESLTGLSILNADVINVNTINAVTMNITNLNVITINATTVNATNGRFINVYTDNLYANLNAFISLHNSIIPSATNTYSLGNALSAFNNIFCVNIYASGLASIGTYSPIALATATINSLTTSAYNIANIGTLTVTDGSSQMFGFYETVLFAPAGFTNTIAGFFTNTNLNLTSNVGNASGFYSNPLISGGATLQNHRGFFSGNGTLSSGTVVNAYGAYFAKPSFGNNANALYADDISIGYTGITPGTGNMIVSGQLSVGTSTPVPSATVTVEPLASSSYDISLGGTMTTIDGSSNMYGILMVTVYQPSAPANIISAIYTNTNVNLTSNVGLVAGFHSDPNVAGGNTIFNHVSFLADFGSTSGGTVNNAYGGYFNRPVFGTIKNALYANDICVGYTATMTTGNDILVSGQLGVGTSAPSVNTVVNIYADTTRANVLQFDGTMNTVTSTEMAGIRSNITLSPSIAANRIFGFIDSGIYDSQPALTHALATSFGAFPTMSGSGTITNYAGFFFYGSNAVVGTPTITNSYGGHFQQPSWGTNKCALYGDNVNVGNPGRTMTNGDIYISGNEIFGQSSGTKTTTVYAQVSAANVTFALPIDNGTSGYLLRSDGAGLTSWVTPPSNVVMGTSTGQTTTISTSPVNTGLAATITLSTVTSTVKIRVCGVLGNTAGGSGYASIDRNGTDISGGPGFSQIANNLASIYAPCSISYIDSPASTSALTYTVTVFCNNAGFMATWNIATVTTIVLEEIFT